jgi:uncharacterized MAPEG superfamily protein
MVPHLTILQQTLLGFAVWTLAVLTFAIGGYRWTRIFAGRAAVHEFPADGANGPDWYRRATRAHANCIENLPVFGAIVFTASIIGATSALLDVLGVVILSARVCQSLVHISFDQTSRIVSVRFSFFFIQLVAMGTIIVVLLRH